MNYRNIYLNETRVDIPKDFEVHHLDLNRDNNDIDNLVALPKDLHTLFHARLNDVLVLSPKDFKSFIMPISPSGHDGFDLFMEYLQKFEEVRSEVVRWIFFRDYLLNRMPNVLEMSYEYPNKIK